MTQRELQGLITKIYITHQKNRWKAWGEYHKEGTGDWRLAEDERTLDITITGEEAAKWTF